MIKTLTSIFILLGLTACQFWESDAPDFFEKDEPIKLTVIWDHKTTETNLERKAWQTTDSVQIKAITNYIDMESYQPLSLLLNRGMTRMIFQMKSGHVWEVGINEPEDKPKYFPIFNRNDRGWSGKLAFSTKLVNVINQFISTSTSLSTDIGQQYSREIASESLRRIIPESTNQVLAQYPGYPEEYWDSTAKKFQTKEQLK